MSEAAAVKAPAEAAGSNKLLLLIVLMFNLLIAGGLTYVVISGQKRDAAAARAALEGAGDGHDGETDDEGHPKKPRFGPLVEVGSFVANLGGPATKSYIRVALHVEAVNEEAKLKVEAGLVPMRSEALLFLSGLSVEEVGGQEKIKLLQEELLKRMTTLLGTNTIKRVYFSEFVIQ